MKLVETFRTAFWRWLDHVAEAMIVVIAKVVTPRTVRLMEEAPNQFVILSADKKSAAGLRGAKLRIENNAIVSEAAPQFEAALRGSRLDLTLMPDRFMFRPLDLPSRAAEFFDGVVRAQIDRLTPWNAETAAFGFSAPVDAGSGRLIVTVAATAKALLDPLVQAFAAYHTHAITIVTRPPDAPEPAPAIAVMNKNVAGILSLSTARRIPLILLVSLGLASITATVGASFIDHSLDARQQELARRIAQRRVAALAAHDAAVDQITAAEWALAKRKNETPSAVIALEALSRVLPDRTYVTELRIEADKLRLTGITDDAPGLIRLMERTPQFTQATFFAPITRSPSDPGDRFNIEARIEPVFSLSP